MELTPKMVEQGAAVLEAIDPEEGPVSATELAANMWNAMTDPDPDPYGTPKPVGLITEDDAIRAVHSFCRSQNRTDNLAQIVPIIEGFLRWNGFDDLARAVAITPVWIESGLPPDATSEQIHAAANAGSIEN